MIARTKDYFSRLSHGFGEGWTNFWFVPSDPATVSAIRLLTGVVLVYLHATLSFDLVAFFGPQGLLPVIDIASLEANTFSYLNYATSATELWIMHLAGLVVLLLFAAGLWTRVTTVLALIVFLSVVHRAPMITGRTEVVIAMVLLYLCFAPCGARFSLDRRRLAGKTNAVSLVPSTTATIATRLIQIHLALLVAMMAFSQLSSEIWWGGTGLWFLMTREQSRLIDFTSWGGSPLLIDFLTHAFIAFEVAFPILVWFPLLRPLMLGLAVVMWGGLALVTGDVTFGLMMLIASVAFVSPAAILAFANRNERRLATS